MMPLPAQRVHLLTARGRDIPSAVQSWPRARWLTIADVSRLRLDSGELAGSG
jgi:hypothetical protein